MKENKECKNKFLLKVVFCLVLLLILVLFISTSNKALAAEEDEVHYLCESDLLQIKRMQYDQLRYNEVNGGGKIAVKIEGAYYEFDNGLWAHAASEVIFSLTNAGEYDYFETYTGLNRTAASSSNGVIFKIYLSDETTGDNWRQVTNEDSVVTKPGENATYVKIPIKGAKRIYLKAENNGHNGNDHSVYADAKLTKEGYGESEEKLVPSIAELDARIKEFIDSGADLTTNKEYELTLLKREFINRAGNYALKRFLGESEENRLVYTWLTEDVDILRLYIMGGTPAGGSHYNALKILTELYDEYSSDFEKTNPETDLLNNPTYPEMTYGDLYKKMAISIALTHTQRVGLWMQSEPIENRSEPLRRYAIFKYLHKNGKMIITNSMDMTHMFEDLHVAEMRLVLSNNIDDEEILWLNKYVQDNVDRNPGNVWRYTTPHPYIAYVWPNYANPVYYAPENESYFNQLFAVDKSDDNIGTQLVNENGEKIGRVGLFDSEFVIPGGKNVKQYNLKITRGTSEYKLYKVWMNFRNKFGTGAVCGGISKSGANIRGTHGIPAIVVGQPGHAALLFYSKDAQGRGYWRLDNDVSGWTQSGGGGNLLGWGGKINNRRFLQWCIYGI